MKGGRLAELSTPPLAAAAADRLAASPGAERSWRRWLLKLKPSQSTFRRRVFPPSADPTALLRSDLAQLAEPSTPPLATAVGDRLAARAGAERRPLRRWLLKLKCSRSTFCRRVFPPSFDPAALYRSGRPIVPVSLHGAVFAVLGLGAAGSIALHFLIATGVITTQEQYFGLILFCLTELRCLLAAAGKVWDVYSGLMWLWEDMKLQHSVEEQLIPAPPPPELDIC